MRPRILGSSIYLAMLLPVTTVLSGCDLTGGAGDTIALQLARSATAAQHHLVRESDEFQSILQNLPEDVRVVWEPVLNRAVSKLNDNLRNISADTSVTLNSELIDVRRGLQELHDGILEAMLKIHENPQLTNEQRLTDILQSISFELELAPPEMGPFAETIVDVTWNDGRPTFVPKENTLFGAHLQQPGQGYQLRFFSDSEKEPKIIDATPLLISGGQPKLTLLLSELAPQCDRHCKRVQIFHMRRPEHFSEFVLEHHDAPPPPKRLERIVRVRIFNRSLDDKAASGFIRAELIGHGQLVARIDEWGAKAVFAKQTSDRPNIYDADMLVQSGRDVMREVDAEFPDWLLRVSVHPYADSAFCDWRGIIWVNIETEYEANDGKNVVGCCYTSRESPIMKFTQNVVSMPGDRQDKRPAFEVEFDFEKGKNAGNGRKITKDTIRPKL